MRQQEEMARHERAHFASLREGLQQQIAQLQQELQRQLQQQVAGAHRCATPDSHGNTLHRGDVADGPQVRLLSVPQHPYD